MCSSRCRSVRAYCGAVRGDCESVNARCGGVTPDCYAVSGHFQTVSVDCWPVSGDCGTVSVDCWLVSGDCEPVSGDCTRVTLDCDDVISNYIHASSHCTYVNGDYIEENRRFRKANRRCRRRGGSGIDVSKNGAPVRGPGAAVARCFSRRQVCRNRGSADNTERSLRVFTKASRIPGACLPIREVRRRRRSVRGPGGGISTSPAPGSESGGCARG